MSYGSYRVLMSSGFKPTHDSQFPRMGAKTLDSNRFAVAGMFIYMFSVIMIISPIVFFSPFILLSMLSVILANLPFSMI